VHRALADPRHGGQPTVSRLHDILAEALPLTAVTTVLDAGCGMGGTMLDVARRSHARCRGITLSERQAALGRAAFARAGLADRLRIEVGDYDDPPTETFDVVIAIESLAHSPNPAATLSALTTRLAPGGHIAIVDDLPEPGARGTPALARFQSGWRVPALLGGAEIRAELARLGLTLTLDRDLTHELRPRSRLTLAALATLNYGLRFVARGTRMRRLLESYDGGLALESLYRDGLMRYGLVVAQRG
jgi:SAM-dependent methyltransferase